MPTLKIVRMDITNAMKIPGVVDIVTWKDDDMQEAERWRRDVRRAAQTLSLPILRTRKAHNGRDRGGRK